MGDSARQHHAQAFSAEFGDDIAKLSSKDRSHEVFVAPDFDNRVRLWTKVGDYEYMADVVLYDPDGDWLEDFSELLGLLGLEETDENRAAVQARLKKAGL